MTDRPDLRPQRSPDRLSGYWMRQWPVLVVAAVTGVLFNGSMSLIPVLQGRLLDTVVYASPMRAVLRQAALFLAAVTAIQILRAVKRYAIRVFANRTGAVMRRMIYNNLLHRDMTGQTGDLLSKAVGDVDLCVEGMRKVTTEVFDTGVLMLGYLISLLAYDPKITLLACLSIPAAMWLAERLKAVIVRCNQAARTQNSAVAERTYSDLEHLALYRVDGVMPLRQKEYEAELADLEEKAVRAAVLENSMQPVYNVIAMLGVSAVLWLGGGRVIAGTWTVGTFTAYLSIFTALALKASKAAKLFNSVQKSAVSWKRLKPYLTGHQTADHAPLPPTGAAGLICENLTFRHHGGLRDAVTGVSFTAGPGAFVGVTGPVAGGKSSLGLALTGAYPHGGRLVLNGHDLGALTPAQRSGLVAYAGHAPQLLSDTIYHNITLGREGDIGPVLADVCFMDDLAAMPQGIDTVVGGGGVRLSGGQQDRIALARALWHAEALVILDDPFSAVDGKTEAQILQNLRDHYPNCVFVILSHRIATFPALDQVLYLADGAAVGGTHASLLADCSPYRALFAMQTGGTHK